MIPLNRNLAPLQRSGIRVFTNLARQTPDCVLLTIGEPDFATPEAIKAAAREALGRDETHYAPNQGTPELRRAIADFETNRGLPTGENQVLVTVGATGALYTALTGIINPGEEVIILTPAFSLYETVVTAAGGKPVLLDISDSGFQLTPALLGGAVTEKTKAIILNSPCNPTGTVLNEDSLAAVKAAVLGKPIFVVCDNVYQALSYGSCPDLSLDPELEEQVLLCQSFSKPYAMTGWRVGYLRCPAYVMDRLLLLNAAEIAAVPTFLQHAAARALEQDVYAMRETYRRRRDYVTGRLRAMGLSFPEPEGAFYVFPDIRRFGLSSWDFCTRLITEGKLAVIPGSCFGCEGHIRISYCYSDEELKTGLDRLEAFIGSFK
ncbi:MAG: aminotransferase class I/II-fold pyridoxal phosphate-dependent enzyme [Clostridiales bacterium]|nr:aminotransferase class I/II-fold pyridoxal phosphate-dependent enzyme [Clostridiales bacterium]